MKVVFAAPARRELMRAAVWYDTQSPGLGDRLLGAVGTVLADLKAFPHAYPVISESNRKCLVGIFPYALIYRVDSASGIIWIMAVAHASRKPNYWRARRKTPE
jgi:toxin ParE1/3/4